MNITAIAPNYITAYLWDARSASKIEQIEVEKKTGEVGYALPKFTLLISKIGSDTIKYAPELLESFSYMGSYNISKKPADYASASSWFKRIYNLDPKNKQWQISSLKKQAVVKYIEKKYSEARDLYLQVKQMDAKDPDADKAIKELEKIIKAQAAAQQ